MKVLIVEDDVKLSETYNNILGEKYKLVLCGTLSDARKLIKKDVYDVVLLDLMLPDGKGYSIIPHIRKYSADALIIVISALEQEKSRKIAYDNGADDYIIKPITLFELEYKLKAIARRRKQDTSTITIGDLILNIEELTLCSPHHEKMVIQHSQCRILKLLYDKFKEGEILYKKELLEHQELVDQNNIRLHTLISRLRKTIEELGSERVFIENIYGKGYRLVVMS